MSKESDLGARALKVLLPDWFSYQLGKLRPGSSVSEVPWNAPLNGAPCYLDSLELVTLAGLAADHFQIRRAGLEDYLLARRTLEEWKDLIGESWRRTELPALQFPTSGTTGSPVYHTHLLSHLVEEVEYFAALLEPRPLRIASTVPSRHIYGFLFSALLPAALDIPSVPLSLERPRWEDGDLILAHPLPLTLWRQRNLELPRGASVLTSTGALGEAEWDWLGARDIPVMEIFGSSETAGLGWRKSRETPFTLLPWWQAETIGTDRRVSRPGREGSVPLPDVLEWTETGKFLPGGRKDLSLKIGGRLVSGEAVEKVLSDHPLVAQVRLRLVETPLGNRFQALVVPRGVLPEEDLRQWASARLDSAARPASYLFMEKLPVKNVSLPEGI